jgi:hypothetical protein
MENAAHSQGPNHACRASTGICATGIVLTTLHAMLGIFRSRAATLVTVSLLVIAGVGGWIFAERSSQAMLWSRTETKAAEISQAYVDTIRESLPLLKQASWSNQLQKEGIVKLENVTEEVAAQPGTSIVTILQNVTRMQVAVASLLSIADTSQLVAGPFSDLQRAVGDRGAISDAIEEYNMLAREWNQRSSSFLGSVAAGVGDAKPLPLPYLRVNGLDEALIINI